MELSANRMNAGGVFKPIAFGIIAAIILLAIYFSVVSLVSGWSFAKDQFSQFWYFVLSLSAGFGIQIGMYSYLRQEIRFMHIRTPRKTVAVTGTTSTIAMISCCSHYLVNIIPIMGIGGALSIIGQYQKELFWAGLAFNAWGILYIARKIYKFNKHLL